MRYNICSIQPYRYVCMLPYMSLSNHFGISTHMFLDNYYILRNNYSDNPYTQFLQHLQRKALPLKLYFQQLARYQLLPF